MKPGDKVIYKGNNSVWTLVQEYVGPLSNLPGWHVVCDTTGRMAVLYDDEILSMEIEDSPQISYIDGYF